MKAINFMKSWVFLFFTVLLFFSCKNSDNSKSPTDTSTQDTKKPQTHIVEIIDMKFQPSDLMVHKGDTVIWINKDIVAHDVTADNKSWTSAPLVSDATWKKVITQSDSYYCSIHVIMKGKITIEE